MPRPANTFLDDFLAADSGETQTLAIVKYKNGTTKYFATEKIEVDANEFVDNLVVADDIEQSIDGGTDRVSITIQNVDKQIGLDVKAGLVHFAQVSLGKYYRNNSGDYEWREQFFGEAIPQNYNQREAKIEILDDWVAAGYCVANWTLSDVCQLIFKSVECGYEGEETYCNHKLKGDCTKFARTFRNVSETFPIVKNPTNPTAPSDGGIQSGGGNTGWGGTGGGNTCLLGETLILMADWTYKRIDEIKIGDFVMSFDEHGKLHPAKVLRTFINHFKSYRDLRFEYSRLGITGKHGILQSSLRFKQARFFMEENKSLFLDKNKDWSINPVRSNAVIKSDLIPFYNFEVEHFHTYIANNTPVHNLSDISEMEKMYDYSVY